MRIVLTALIVLFAFLSWAQKPSELAKLKQLYPEHDFVIIKDYNLVTISHHKEKGVEIIKTTQRDVYLTTDRAGLFKNDYIFTSFFEKEMYKEAHALNKVKGKDKYEKVKVRDFETKETMSEEFFYDDGVVTSFNYEGLKNESIISMTYTRELTEPYLSVSSFFSSTYPLINKSLTIVVEDGIELSTVYFNMDSTDVNYSKTHNKNKTTYTWQVDTSKIYKNEEASPPANYFAPHLMNRILYYTKKDGQKVRVLENVQDLYNWYMSLLNQVTCDNTVELQAIVDEIISPEDSELEKVKKVFNWVQAHIKYIAIEDGLGGFIPRDPSLVMSRRYGDCKDMSTIIVQLLELQGIKAHQAWIGTNDLPYKYEEMPSPAIDNHMIAAYFDAKSDSYIFLDATDAQIPFGFPSQFIQGKEALINIDGNYKIVEVPIVSAYKTDMLDSVQVKIVNDSLVGEGRLRLTGFYASDSKYALKNISTEKAKKTHVGYLTKKGSNKYQLDNYRVNLEENAVVFDYNFSIPSYVNRTENEIYVNLNLDLLLDFFTPYDVKDRKTGVTESYASQTKHQFVLEIPKGYEVDYVPQDLFVDGGKEFYLKINYKQDEPGKITYSFEIFLDYILLDVDRIPEMKELGKKVKNAYKETIILKKI